MQICLVTVTLFNSSLSPLLWFIGGKKNPNILILKVFQLINQYNIDVPHVNFIFWAETFKLCSRSTAKHDSAKIGFLKNYYYCRNK